MVSLVIAPLESACRIIWISFTKCVRYTRNTCLTSSFRGAGICFQIEAIQIILIDRPVLTFRIWRFAIFCASLTFLFRCVTVFCAFLAFLFQPTVPAAGFCVSGPEFTDFDRSLASAVADTPVICFALAFIIRQALQRRQISEACPRKVSRFLPRCFCFLAPAAFCVSGCQAGTTHHCFFPAGTDTFPNSFAILVSMIKLKCGQSSELPTGNIDRQRTFPAPDS